MERKTTQGQYLFILLGAFVLTCCFFGASYALNNRVEPNAEFNYFETENLELSYADYGKGDGDILSLINPSLKTEQEARKEAGYRFSVSNISNTEKKYRLRLIEDYGIVTEEDCLYKEISPSNIYFQFDNQAPKRLIDIENNGYLLYESQETILPGNTEIHELRIWAGEKSPELVKQEHYHGKVLLEEVKDNYPAYSQGQKLTIGQMTYMVIEDSDETNGFIKLMPTKSYTYEGNPCEGSTCLMVEEEKIKELLENNQIQLENALGQVFDFSVFHERVLTKEEWETYSSNSLLTEAFQGDYWLYDETDGYQVANLTSSLGEVRGVILLYKELLKDKESK